MCCQRQHSCFEIRQLKIQKIYKWTVREFILSLIYSLKLFLWHLLLQHHSLDPGTTVSTQSALIHVRHSSLSKPWYLVHFGFLRRVFLSSHGCHWTHYVDTQRSACLGLVRAGIKASLPLAHVTFYMRYNFKINYRGSRKAAHFVRCLHENIKARVWSPESMESEPSVTCSLSQI